MSLSGTFELRAHKLSDPKWSKNKLICFRRWRRSLTWSTMRLSMCSDHTPHLQGLLFLLLTIIIIIILLCFYLHIVKAKYSAPTASREASKIPGKGEILFWENLNNNTNQPTKESLAIEWKKEVRGRGYIPTCTNSWVLGFCAKGKVQKMKCVIFF